MKTTELDLERDRKHFFEHGFIGPFQVLTPEETHLISATLRRQVRLKPNGIYPENTANHDRHLDLPLASWLISHPLITKRVQAVLGEDLLCWRSSFFPKFPGDAGTEWHQAKEFYEFEGKPHLQPTDPDCIYEATAWMAFTPTNRRNACLRVIPGSHRTFFFDESTAVDFQGANQHIEVNGERLGFYGYSYEPMKKDANWKPDPKDEFAFELEPGQCVIFTSRLLHGSYPNSSENEVRLGFATRFCAEQVKVYPDAKTFRMFGEERPLDRYSAVLVGGSAKLGHNVTSTPLPLGEEELAVVKPHAQPTAEARTVQPAP